MPLVKDVPILCSCPGMPHIRNHGLGSIWECDNPQCRQRWVLKEHPIDGPCWVTMAGVKATSAVKGKQKT
jgi:hypothetical protein